MAVVFLLFTVYPVVAKLVDGRLAHDWLHSALHLDSALAAIYTGWVAPKELPVTQLANHPRCKMLGSAGQPP